MVSVWYIDNVFFIWTHGKEKLRVFLENLNKCHTNIKFKHETNKENVAFLDLKVKLLDGKISTDLFVKSTDCHHFFPLNIFINRTHQALTVFSQALSVSRICSYKPDFVRHFGNMKSWFSEREYPSDLVEGKTKKVKFIPNVKNRNRSKSIK